MGAIVTKAADVTPNSEPRSKTWRDEFSFPQRITRGFTMWYTFVCYRIPTRNRQGMPPKPLVHTPRRARLDMTGARTSLLLRQS